MIGQLTLWELADLDRTAQKSTVFAVLCNTLCMAGAAHTCHTRSADYDTCECNSCHNLSVTRIPQAPQQQQDLLENATPLPSKVPYRLVHYHSAKDMNVQMQVVYTHAQMCNCA